jgi:hypothetical protein
MSEYVYASILLPTAVLEIPEIIQALAKEDIDTSEKIAPNVTYLDCNEAPDGEFTYFEKACEALQIPYDRNNQGDYIVKAEIKYFRPGSNPISFYALDEEPIIPLPALVNYINTASAPITVEALYTHFHIPIDSVGDYHKREDE